ncbi:hypothetical protein N9M40_01965 [Candidatus Poseidoniales archaeon]|nr:hypothetical protein [Candidatus Poseidoniales archaeon]MDA8724572.1 hypothetical protein [Candidatus Poseidoniales archaeon]
MTTDKMFILLLVIMLPLTGCLDIADNAEAEDSEEETTIVNNYYNNTTTTTMPMVHPLHLEANTNATIQFDGDTTMKVETIYRTGGSSTTMAVESIHYFDMTCNGTSIVSSAFLADDEYLPVLAGQSCTVLIQMNQYGALIMFSEASLSAL